MDRVFDPWVGEHYATTGIDSVRLLLLGESHYGDTERSRRSTFTQEIVPALGFEGRHRFFTIVRRLVIEAIPGVIKESQRREFWHRVAFYNYIQEFVGDKPRCRPTPEMWQCARQPFLDTLQELDPQVVLVLGRQLERKLPCICPSIQVCRFDHPSSRYFFRNRNQYLQEIAQAVGKVHERSA